MANLGQTFDANSVAPAETMDVVPAGNYRAQIVNSDMRPTKDGNGRFLWLELAIIDGPCANRRLFDRLNLVNANPQAVEIANRTLSSICHATGHLNVSDSEVFHFKPMDVKVAVRAASADGEYGPQNEVKGYSPARGASPVTSAQAPAARATTAPWKKSA